MPPGAETPASLRGTAAGLLALALLGGCASRPPAAPTGCEVAGNRCMDALMQALDDWQQAYNDRDPRRLQALYAPGAVITDDEYWAVPLSGPGLPSFFDEMVQRPSARMRWKIGHLQLFGDTAVRSGECEFDEQVEGRVLTRQARYSLAYQHLGGRWLIVLQHLTLHP